MLIAFWSQTGGRDLLKKRCLVLDLLQVRKVRRSGKVIEKAMPTKNKIGLQIEALAIQGLILEFWVLLENVAFLDEFSVGQQSATNLKISISHPTNVTRSNHFSTSFSIFA